MLNTESLGIDKLANGIGMQAMNDFDLQNIINKDQSFTNSISEVAIAPTGGDARDKTLQNRRNTCLPDHMIPHDANNIQMHCKTR